jgi:transcriptional regulator of arginine metabolism
MHVVSFRVNHFVIIPGSMRRHRHKVIVELVRGQEISSQEDLMRELKARNIEVSQSTLSRDIQELNLAKAGGVYTVVEAESPKPSEDSLRRIFQEFVAGVEIAQNIVVVKTGRGHASTVSQALDDAELPESVGSLAGEDTIFVAVRSMRAAKKLQQRMREFLE